MLFPFKPLTYTQKLQASEALYLLILCVLIPVCIGLQIFSKFSHTASLIVVNLLQIPSIILLYRWYLPQTIFAKRVGWFFLLLPVFVLIYEFNSRLTYIIVLALPFIPDSYKQNLAAVHPTVWDGHLIQNLDYSLLIILTAFAFVLVKELFKRQHTMDQLQSDKLQLELDQLKSQIQPHFFFNTLNNLYALSLQGSPKTSVTIANLSGIMRYVLYEAQGEKVLLAKEIAFMHSYLDLERIRHNDEHSIEFSVQGNPNGLLIEPLLFLPLIENCFKHSLHKKIPNNQVRIAMTVDADEIVFQTTNLIDPTAQAQKDALTGGIGLRNVQKRLQLLYPDKHQLSIGEENGVFTVTLSLQLS